LFATADPDELEEISRQYRFGPLLYLITFGLAFVSCRIHCRLSCFGDLLRVRRQATCLLTDCYRLGSATAGAG
jgi:hypothetical protein